MEVFGLLKDSTISFSFFMFLNKFELQDVVFGGIVSYTFYI